MVELIYKDEVFRIVGAAFEVYNELGPGFLEAVYQEAMEITLTEKTVPFTPQAPLRIMFRGRVLRKQYIADLICFGCVMVELKAQSELTGVDEAQLLNEMKATGMRVGVLLNFGAKNDLQWKRLIR